MPATPPSLTSVDPAITTRALENATTAAACGAPPAQVVAVAIASLGSVDAAALCAWVAEHRAELEQMCAAPVRLDRMPELPKELRYEPELARMRLDIGDHELRGQLVFQDLLEKKSFFQVAALAIGGVELSAKDGELLGHCGVLTQLADPRIWPLTVVRRVAAHGGGLAASVVAGMATLLNPRMAALPVAGFMRALERIDAERTSTGDLERVVDAWLARKERIPGVGRPVVGTDERVGPKLALLARYGRADGPSVTLARDLDALLEKKKGLRVNSAGFQAALLRDLGFSPTAAAALCVLYFAVPVLAHAVYADERALGSGPTGGSGSPPSGPT